MKTIPRGIACLSLLMTAHLLMGSSELPGQVERVRSVLNASEIISTVREVFGSVADGAAVNAGGPVKIDEARLQSLTRLANDLEQRTPAAPPDAPSVGLGDVADGIKAHDALARLERYGAARADHLSRLERETRAAQVELRAWERREASVRRITDRLGGLMGDPAAAAFFQNELGFAWVDYETALMPRVAAIVNAQRKLVARYEAAVRKLQSEDKAYESNMVLVREAIRELDRDAKFVGTWSIVQTVDFECERINGSGMATVQKSSRSGEYVASEHTQWKRTIKNGCEFEPGYRLEWAQEARKSWTVNGDRVTIREIDGSGGGKDSGGGKEWTDYRLSGSTLTAKWTHDGGPHVRTYTRR